jgi:serine/threonine protein kinase
MARSFQQGDEPVVGYKLSRFLGRGGFGEVWQATAPGGTEVAFKIIDLGEKSGLKEFRSIQRVKRVRHPNLVPIIALWLRDENGKLVEEMTFEQLLNEGGDYKPAELFIAMGLGDKSLHDRYKECKEQGLQGVPGLELISYIEDAARAIDHLNSPKHDLGNGPVSIQHCDIKPQNILIVGDAAQVCDFGLARVLGENRSTTNPAVTLAFAAPEILEDSNPSSTTDQYALAMSYYYLRTGTLPFSKVDPSTIIMEALDGRLDFSRVSTAEQAVIKRATSRKPTGRFTSCMDMARELRRALENAGGASKAATLVIEPGSEIVSGHKLVRCLGRGAYGEVWEAMAPGRIPVALKIIRDLDRAGGRGKQEFKALEVIQRVTHNHLMELRAYWLLDRQGQPIPDEVRGTSVAPISVTLIIATKLADKNLAQVLEEYQARGMPGIPMQELLRYTRQAAEAIDYLNAPRHKLGDRRVSIQHRDVKPDNIMLADGIVRLTDFGLAKVVELDEVSAEIHQDSVGFTFHYAAPEVMRGRVTKWSDQYSLAITYYFLRTGQLPFERVGSAYDMMMRQLEGKLDLSLLPEPERRVLNRAVSVVPEDRYPTCLAFIQAIEATLPSTGDTLPLPHKPQSRRQSAFEMDMLQTPAGALPSTHRHPEPMGGPPGFEPSKPFGTPAPAAALPSAIPPSSMPLPMGSPSAYGSGTALGNSPSSGMSLFGTNMPMPEALAATNLGLQGPDDLEMLDDAKAPHAAPTSRPYGTKVASSPEPPPLPPEDSFGTLGAGNLPAVPPGLSLVQTNIGMETPPPTAPSSNRRPRTMHADNLLDLYPELQPVFAPHGGPPNALGGSLVEPAPSPSQDELTPYGTERPEGEQEQAQEDEPQHPRSKPHWQQGRKEPPKPNYLVYGGVVLAGVVLVVAGGMLWSKMGGDRSSVVEKTDTPKSSEPGKSNVEPIPTKQPDNGNRVTDSGTGVKPIPTAQDPPKIMSDPGKEQREKIAALEEKFRHSDAIQQESEFRRLGQELTAINNEYLPAELLGRKAEYYVETAEGRNSRNVSEARTCLDLARSRGAGVTQEGWYHYVEARLLYKQNQGNTAAIALARTDNKYITGFRTKKALEVYDRAAKDWTATLKIDANALGQEPTSGPIWMPQAAALCASSRDAKLSPDMLLLFTWTSPTPKPEHLDQLLDTADAKEIARRDDGPLALAELYRRRAESRKVAEPTAAVSDYLSAYNRIKDLKEDKVPMLTKYQVILAPALAHVETVQKNQLDDRAKLRVSELYAAKGDMIFKDPLANWPNMDEPYRDASKAYEKALEFFPEESDRVKAAHYHVQRGLSLTRLTLPQLTMLEIQDIEQDARKATELDPNSAEASALLGVALLFQATLDQASRRTAEDERNQRVLEELRRAVAAQTKAINLGRDNASKEDLSFWHANRAQATFFLASMITTANKKEKDPAKEAEARRRHQEAIEDARKAINFNKENENAFAALGFAYELYAFFQLTCSEPNPADAQDNLKKAEAAFQEQIRLRPLQVVAQSNLGQLYAQQGYLAQQKDMQAGAEFFRKGRAALTAVIQKKPTHVDANYWLGFIAAQEQRWEEAGQCLFKSLQDPKYLRYNLENRIVRTFPKEALDKILSKTNVDTLSNKPADLAPWMILRALHLLLHQDKMWEKWAKRETFEQAFLAPLQECMGFADKVRPESIPNPTLRSMALEISAETRILAARVSDVPKEERLRYLEEARDRLKKLSKKLTPDLDQRWAFLAEGVLELCRLPDYSREQLRKMLSLTDEALREAEGMNPNAELKTKLRKHREDWRDLRSNAQ